MIIVKPEFDKLILWKNKVIIVRSNVVVNRNSHICETEGMFKQKCTKNGTIMQPKQIVGYVMVFTNSGFQSLL